MKRLALLLLFGAFVWIPFRFQAEPPRAPTAGRPVVLPAVAGHSAELSQLAGGLRPSREGELGRRIESDLSAAEIERLQSEALALPASGLVSTGDRPGGLTFNLGFGFDSIDVDECCDSGTLNPPDPELAVGPEHIVAVVNASLEIYDKAGNSLTGAPIPLESFYSSLGLGCTIFAFDPNVLYDERADRFIIAADGNSSEYCVGVTQTGDPTGAYHFYAFPVDVNGLDFDYPHAGVGLDAIYVGANMFGGGTGQVFAFEKAAMYAGAPAAMATVAIGSNSTPQPMNLHEPFPTGGPHYIFTSRSGFGNPSTFGLFSWDDPFGANVFTDVTTLDLPALHGVTVGFPVSNPQSGGGNITSNDARSLDFAYRDGFGYAVSTVSCNPGGGTVTCVQWAKVDLTTETLADAGVFGSDGEYRFFPDLAVNECGDMMLGFSRSSSSSFPGIGIAGREANDFPGSIQGAIVMKAGEVTFGEPSRWGDYTGMTIDPDGQTFWYLGEYSKSGLASSRNWGTFIGSASFVDCRDDEIFADGFESGDTSAWSVAVP